MVGILEYESDMSGHFADAVVADIESVHDHAALDRTNQSVQVLRKRGLA